MSNDSEMFGQLSVTAIMRMGSSIGILSLRYYTIRGPCYKEPFATAIRY